MNEPTDDAVIQLVRSVVSKSAGSPSSELWPRVRRRVDRTEPPSTGDYLLAAVAFVTCLLQPSLITHIVLMF